MKNDLRERFAPRASRHSRSCPATSNALDVCILRHGDLDRTRLTASQCEDRATTVRWIESRGRFRANHRDAVGAIVYAKGYAKVGVREHCVTHRGTRPLRAENKVHAKGAATGGNVAKERMQVGVLVDDCRKLVNHDDESRQARHLTDITSPG